MIENLVPTGISGRCGKDLPSKNINGKPFHRMYPDRSQVKYTKEPAKIKVSIKRATKFPGSIVTDGFKAAAGKKKSS